MACIVIQVKMEALMLEIYTRNLLTRIALDFNLSRAELDIKFMNAEIKVVKKRAKKVPEPLPFVREDDPGPSDGLTIDDRIRAILDAADEEPEPDSPGGVRHATFLKYKERGATWDSYYSTEWPQHLETLEERLEYLVSQPSDQK